MLLDFMILSRELSRTYGCDYVTINNNQMQRVFGQSGDFNLNYITRFSNGGKGVACNLDNNFMHFLPLQTLSQFNCVIGRQMKVGTYCTSLVLKLMLKNYRPIWLLSTISKIFASLVYPKLFFHVKQQTTWILGPLMS